MIVKMTSLKICDKCNRKIEKSEVYYKIYKIIKKKNFKDDFILKDVKFFKDICKGCLDDFTKI